MWKTTLLLLAVVLCTVQGSYRNGLGVSSWDKMLAELMDHHNVETGTCSPDKCYVSADGKNRLMNVGDTFVFSDKPCLEYSCERTGVRETKIECREAICDNGAPVKYPGQCCEVCVGQPTEPVEFGPWTEWTECSRSCGGGRQARVRECIIPPGADEADCTGFLREVQDCNTHLCPVNCEWEWGEYEACTRTCGGGTKSRFPIITQHAQYGGEPCPPDVRNNVPETMDCENNPCPVDCRWTDWKQWSMCTKTCNGGTRTRTREKIEGMHGGKPCIGASSETEDCNTQPCPVNCVWEPWREWSPCSATCNGGTRTRSRGRIEEKYGGKPCVGPSTQSEECNTNPCPVDCKWGAWKRWSACTRSCDGGRRTRTREVLIEARYGGRDCVGSSRETEDCNTSPCPACEPGYHKCEGMAECIPDQDKDCIEDGKDNCVAVANKKQGDQDGDGVGDACDNCIYAYNPGQENNDGDRTGDECDEDDDNDKLADNYDLCGKIYSPDNRDRDNDGTGDCCDDCTMVFRMCHTRDQLYKTDSDGDGLPDECDNCPKHYNPKQSVESDGKLPCERQQSYTAASDYHNDMKACEPGYHKCEGMAECIPDQDKDCVEDQKDNCAAVANANQNDEDGDGVGDGCDNCIYAYNPGQENDDGDTEGNACDEDDDNDGVADVYDHCGKIYSPDNRDRDNDGAGDCCDDCTMVFGRCLTRDQLYKTDSDGDGLPDECDNCPHHYNPEQTAECDACEPGYHRCEGMTECIPDQDKDCIEDQKDNCVPVANANQDDEDGDGVGDACDNCIYAYNPGQENHDGDHTGDECDEDDDNDGVADNYDNCVKTYSPDNRDRDGDGIGDCCDDCTLISGRCFTRDQLYSTDSDGDGLPDECDNCPNHYNPKQSVESDSKLPCQRQQSYAQEAYNDATPPASDYNNNKKGLTAQIMEKLLEMYYSN